MPALRGRLEDLGRELTEAARESGHFPRGTAEAPELPVAERLSFWALWVGDRLPPESTPPQRDLRWRDPLHERFVRRKVPELQNPAVRDQVGNDGYPATHFVGVGGLGADGPELPVDHPRAGIFAYDRATRLEQVRDGLSQTMLVAGVQRELGSWAAGGPATLRPFVHEPYVNGRDGFGTGQADRMLVLMADGSVREVARDTPPEIVHKLVAINDDATPREPPVPVALTPPAPPAPPSPASPEPPAASPAPPPAEPPLPDIPKQLAQPVLKFEQASPAAVRDLLDVISELAAVPIVWETDELGPAAGRLDRKITLQLARTTVQGILSAVLEQAQLGWHIEPRQIRITLPGAPRQPVSPQQEPPP